MLAQPQGSPRGGVMRLDRLSNRGHQLFQGFRLEAGKPVLEGSILSEASIDRGIVGLTRERGASWERAAELQKQPRVFLGGRKT